MTRDKLLDFAIRFSQEVKASEINGDTFQEALKNTIGKSKRLADKYIKENE